MKTWIKALLIIFLAGKASAHPVAYQGAFALMAYNESDTLDWQAVYSVRRYLALGVHYERLAMGGMVNQYLFPSLHLLVHRWNGENYQANIYAYAGYGLAMRPGFTTAAYYGGGEADYETRLVYFSGKASTVLAKDFSDSTLYQARAGFAPYKGSFEGLNTWFIIQSQYFPNALQDKFRIGPLLRFYYQNILWEVGATSKGQWNFNFMIHL